MTQRIRWVQILVQEEKRAESLTLFKDKIVCSQKPPWIFLDENNHFSIRWRLILDKYRIFLSNFDIPYIRAP